MMELPSVGPTWGAVGGANPMADRAAGWPKLAADTLGAAWGMVWGMVWRREEAPKSQPAEVSA